MTGDHEDRADRSVLREETSAITRGGEDDNSTGVHVEGSADSSHGAGFDDADRTDDQVAELLEVRNVRNGVLGLQASLMHLADSLVGIATLSSLTRQHDTVCSISDGVTNVRDLSAGWARVVNHRLQHLGGADNGLAGNVAHGNHLLLGGKHLSSWDLNTQITTSNHDTISFLQDLSKVVETLSVLDLGNDLDVLPVLAKNLADGPDILATADKGSEYHVHIVLDTKSQIGLILLGESWEINVGVGKIDTLLGRDLAVVAGTNSDGLSINDVEDIEGKNTIIDVDDTTLLDDLGNVLVVDVPRRSAEASKHSTRSYLHVLVVRSSSILFIGGDVHLGTSSNGNILVARGVSSSDLRTLGI